MTERWFYVHGEYDSEADAEAAVAATKVRLDNHPEDWVEVKQVTPNEDGSFTVPAEKLTNDQINNLADDSYYNVAELHGGDTSTGLTGVEARAKILEYRTRYAQWIAANTMRKEYAPKNTDMSGYV